MKRRKPTLLLLFMLLCLLLASAGLAAPNAATIDRHVIGGGGGKVEVLPYSLNGTIGQPLVEVSLTSPYELASGFWPGVADMNRLWLPLTQSH